MDTFASGRTLLTLSRAGVEAITFLYGISSDASLSAHHHLRIALYLGQHGMSAYSTAELLTSGRVAGLSELKMQANLMGASTDDLGRTGLGFVTEMIESDDAPALAIMRSMRRMGCSPDAILEITALTATHQLLTRLYPVMSLAVTPTSDASILELQRCDSLCEAAHESRHQL